MLVPMNRYLAGYIAVFVNLLHILLQLYQKFGFQLIRNLFQFIKIIGSQ